MLSGATATATELGREVLLAMPMYAAPASETVNSLLAMACRFGNEMDGWNLRWSSVSRCPFIGPAREALADSAVRGGARYLIFLDADMVWPAQALVRLVHVAEERSLDIVSGWCSLRTPPYTSLIMRWREGVQRFCWPKLAGDLMQCDAVGMAATLIRVSTFAALARPWFPEPMEDINFCHRATEQGLQVWVDTSLVVGHLADPVAAVPFGAGRDLPVCHSPDAIVAAAREQGMGEETVDAWEFTGEELVQVAQQPQAMAAVPPLRPVWKPGGDV